MATYVTYTPSPLIAKAMFNFDVSGQSNLPIYRSLLRAMMLNLPVHHFRL